MAGTSFGGPWTLQKLNILDRYLDAYTTALKNQPFNLIYVDAFAGEGSFSLQAEFYDEFYIDFWWSSQIPGRDAYHWGWSHIDGTIYRHDNMLHP